ncbi:MAG: ADP-ribosylglycohydrolase family protein [Kiritimatiellae bacterium]|nr:ADP-ribosylglycohydrolase family protein [Kiritimatiellia bacterium]
MRSFRDATVRRLCLSNGKILKLSSERRQTYGRQKCNSSVPQALEAFFESDSFEDAIRNAISIGGDSDTIAAIAGAVAGAYYGIPNQINAKASTFLDRQLAETLRVFKREFVL